MQNPKNKATEYPIACFVCKQIPTDLVESKCCCEIFCWECGIQSTNCPSCQKAVGPNTFRPNVPLKRMVEEMELKCKYQDCCLYFKESQRKVHEKECSFRPTTCPKNDLCGIILSKDLEKHLESECQFRDYKCHHCDLILPYYYAEEEHLNECEGVEIACPNYCGTKLQRGAIPKHFEECPLSVVNCGFAEFGCTQQIVRSQLETHLNDEMKAHLTMLTNAFNDQRKEMAEFKTILSEVAVKRPNVVISGKNRPNAVQLPRQCMGSNITACNVTNQIVSILEFGRQFVDLAKQNCAQLNALNVIFILVLWSLFHRVPFFVKLIIGLFTLCVLHSKLKRDQCTSKAKRIITSILVGIVLAIFL